MPLCTLHLLALTRNNTTTSTDDAADNDDPLPHFLTTLRNTTTTKPLTIARPLRWIITPTALSPDLPTAHRWDVLLILPTASPALPKNLDDLVAARWTVTFGVPARVLEGYEGRNGGLLRGETGEGVPALEEVAEEDKEKREGGGRRRLASSAQGLELSGELMDWVRETTFGAARGGGGGGKGRGGAVSMLNLLAFKDGMKAEYLKYGKAFAEDVGRKRGAVAKIVGTVVDDGGGKGVGVGEGEKKKKRVWDEVALAHYPSIWHFADMLASEDYQAVNKRHRVGSLKDTFILCTTELGLPGDDGKESRAAAKL
ncbi:hypothetical protein BK809_0007185 [Diplodia seriata]|uniref:DUF1330 domain-containing protein n=1 Tax=Diplodia seriata TaxID=420778 RepID=A0A1S8BI22_9PEZI|nr:hypothetical protein BK809_0007185 [Diplodia seriata]